MSERASEMAGLVSCIDAQKIAAAGSVTGDVIDASLYDSILFITSIGTVSSCSGDVTFTLYEGTATATVTTTVGTVAHTSSSTGDQNTQLIFDLDCEDLTGPNYRYVKPRLTYAGGTGAWVSMVALGFKPRFHPASDGDLASVTIKTST